MVSVHDADRFLQEHVRPGGLGGFLPPIIMGLVVQATGSYAIGLMLLSDVAFAGAIYAAWRLRDVRLP